LYGEITLEDGYVDEDGIYFEFSYQIDDRVDRVDRMDYEVENSLQNILGDEYGVDVRRIDDYPNGYAYYKIYIDQ
jgi:hypothetical protein